MVGSAVPALRHSGVARGTPQAEGETMFLRKLLASVAVLLTTLTLAAPASADDEIGVNTEFGGFVFSSSGGIPPNSLSLDVYVVTKGVVGSCHYVGVTNVSGGINYTFFGQAHSWSADVNQPELTDIKCTLISPAQGLPGEPATLTASCEAALPGPVAACVGTATNWPLRPVKICVDGYAIFGPFPVETRYITHRCKSASL